MKNIMASIMGVLFLASGAVAAEKTYSLSDLFQVSEGTVVAYKKTYIDSYGTRNQTMAEAVEWKANTAGVLIGETLPTHILERRGTYYRQEDYYVLGASLDYAGFRVFFKTDTGERDGGSVSFKNGETITTLPASINRFDEFTDSAVMLAASAQSGEVEEIAYATTTTFLGSGGLIQTPAGTFDDLFIFTGSLTANQESQTFATMIDPRLSWFSYILLSQASTDVQITRTELVGAYADGVAYPRNGASGVVDTAYKYLRWYEKNTVYVSIFGDQTVDVYLVVRDAGGTLHSLGLDGSVKIGLSPFVERLPLVEVMPLKPFNLAAATFTPDATWTPGFAEMFMVVCEPGVFGAGKIYSVDSTILNIEADEQ